MCNLIWSRDDHNNIFISRTMNSMNCENNVQFIPQNMKLDEETYSLYLVKHDFNEGINQCGLFVNIQVLNYNKNKCIRKPIYMESYKHELIRKIGITRYILERCSDVKEAKTVIETFKRECELLKENVVINYFVADRYGNIITDSSYENKNIYEEHATYSMRFDLKNKSLSIYYDKNLSICKHLILSEEVQGIGYFFKMRPLSSVRI
ncbi:MAG: carcinine hydrolase/isopenicillin-N N-acyltransferase family protein [Clostridium cadaveris]|uniref:carcinine hydrolase/isopenicillin-N N-acyltransferase family protein n=1 Tax=Clostridium cadaveris TaxID=1529 RepID=UPI002A8F22DB|nr:carcinine hydrolase/isopenicillin-N N-acyltransferase family protein [Clostridium cadaveris]